MWEPTLAQLKAKFESMNIEALELFAQGQRLIQQSKNLERDAARFEKAHDELLRAIGAKED